MEIPAQPFVCGAGDGSAHEVSLPFDIAVTGDAWRRGFAFAG
jgi:hypothetical protein